MNLNADGENIYGADIPWLYALRKKARDAFVKNGLPTAKTEAWKYSYLPSGILDEFTIAAEPHHCDGHCHEKESLPFDCRQIKFCNGSLEHIAHDLPRGVMIMPLIEAVENAEIKPYLNKSFAVGEFPFADLNTALAEQGLFILIGKETELQEPIYIHYHQHEGAPKLNNIRNVIVLEKGAKATIIEDFDAKEDAHYFNNIVNEIYVGTDAFLQHYTRQNEAAEARHVALNSVAVKAGGQYRDFIVHNECLSARSESYVCLKQENASAEINGAYRLQNSGHSDITSNIRHLAAHTYSDQLVKGVLDGKAHGVFQGQIHIAPNAQQTEGRQLHRALVLSDGAKVDCKPELEIFADDVKCSHGSTCGDLDAEQLFYMQSRGIALDDARQILIAAYLNEVFGKIEDVAVAEWLKSIF